jgi:hypothetical protein
MTTAPASVTTTQLYPVCVWGIERHPRQYDLVFTDCGRRLMWCGIDLRKAPRICPHCGKPIDLREH